MISGRNIKGMSFRGWIATVPFVSRLSITDSTRTSKVKPRLTSFKVRKSVKNVRLHVHTHTHTHL